METYIVVEKSTRAESGDFRIKHVTSDEGYRDVLSMPLDASEIPNLIKQLTYIMEDLKEKD